MISSASLGVSRATELLLFPEPFSAETVLQWGLVHRVVESGQALAGAQALASRLAQGPTAAYRAVARPAPPSVCGRTRTWSRGRCGSTPRQIR